MRAGIPEPRVRRHTLTTYTDLRGLQRALGLPGLDDIYLFLLDRTGSICWQGRGPYSEATLADLSAALATVAVSS